MIPCEGKEAYPSPQAARKVLEHVRRRGGRAVGSYRCPDCGKYHLFGRALKRPDRIR